MRADLLRWMLFCLLLPAVVPRLPATEPGTNGNTIVRFEIQRGTNALGSFEVELFDQEKPETVRNFLLYVRSGAYTNTFLHRCVPGFVVQGGGFSITNPLSGSTFSSYLEVTNYGRLMNEYSTGPQRSNTFGTIAMAKVGDDPNSATSQWFFNLASNTNLDTQNGGFTVFGRILSNTNASNVLAHFNSLSTAGGIVNVRSLLGTSYAAFTDVPVSYTNTTTRVPVYRELYYVRVSEVNATNTPGLLPPAVQIVSPPPNSTFTNQSVTISGTAQDDTGVARVVYRVAGGAAQGASGATNWSFTVTPQPGLNTVTVESIDWDGKRSTAAAVTFLYVAQVPLKLHTEGSGRIVGAVNGQWLQVGTYQTLTAIPNPGNIFHSWSGTVSSSLATITFFVPTNATNINLTAKFISEPLPRLTGTYHGLFQSLGTPSAANSGSMVLNLANTGEFDGMIYHRGGTYTYTGKFDASGEALIQGEVGGIHRTITLELQKLNNAGLITGTISGTANVRLERLAGSVAAGIALGRHTFAILPPATNSSDQLTPAGYGYGTCRVDPAGLLTFSGRLGDGTAFSGSAPLTRLERWPIYLNMFEGRGVLLGWLAASTNGNGNLDGTLHWVKGFKASDPTYPAGFSNQVVFLGARYPQAAPGERVVNFAHGLAAIRGPFQIGMSNLVKLTTENVLVPLPPKKGITWNLDPVTGMVNGSFVDPWSGSTRTLLGTVLKRTQSILGQFTDRGTVGAFTISAAPFLVTQTVANVTLDGILAALNDGGYLKFTTNAAVTLPSQVTLPFDTMLDANGYSVVFSGGETTRLFRVETNRSFFAKGITFADGFVAGLAGANSSPPEPGLDARGGGILNRGGLVGLTNCVITNCSVQGGMGGKDKSAGVVAPGGRGLGGAIGNSGGRVILNNCQIIGNYAEGGAGNSDAPTQLMSGQRGCGAGGAIFSEGGECQIENTTFLSNGASAVPARFGNATARGGDGLGGALAVRDGRAQISLSEFRNNYASGANAMTNLQSVGAGHGGAILIETNTTASVDQTTFIGNLAASGNSSTQDVGYARGGAIFSQGSLQVRKSTIDQNTASTSSSSSPATALGGGIASLGSVVLDASTISSNAAQAAISSGGGLYCEGGSLFATNSTIAFNSAATEGGAIMLVSNSAVVVHATVAYNTVGGIEHQNSTFRLRNSIVSSNGLRNFSGLIVDEGYNMSSDSSVLLLGNFSTNNVNPLLGPLATNGGPTRTMALLPNSPARDFIAANLSPPVDQRGFVRSSTARGDAGAFELGLNEVPPLFVTHPSGGTVRYGSNFVLTSFASGANVSYSWLSNEVPVVGATNSSLLLSNIQTFEAFIDYRAIASNNFGAVTSVNARVTIDSKPRIDIQPSDVLIAPASSATFSVTATGPGLGYIWYHDGQQLITAVSRILLLTNAAPADKGTYFVIVTNFAGSVTSVTARLNFNSLALSILEAPTNRTAFEGQSVTFNVLASGVQPISYAWLLGTTPIPNATNDQLVLPSVSFSDQASNYRVVVTNAYLSITSAPVSLTVLRQPQLSIRLDGTNVLISATGTPNRQHQLLQSPIINTQAWAIVATNSGNAAGTSFWSRPLIRTQNTYFRVILP